MITSKKTYKMAENPPQPMSWEEYEEKLKAEWNNLLKSKPSEANVQTFLDKHPCLLPGAFNMHGNTSGHYPFPDAVISQPRLQGIKTKQPDFMWLSKNSLEFEPILIEIERPDKKWFNAASDPSGNFVQGHNQLAQWKAWFDHPENKLVFYENFDVPHSSRQKTMRISLVLVFGRRSEYEKKTELNRVRAQLARDNEYLMSYDRLTPSSDARNFFTVKKEPNDYKAIAYPPTYKLSPDSAVYYSMIKDKEKAINDCEWMSSERKDFIKSRFPYWEKWAASKDKGIVKNERE